MDKESAKTILFYLKDYEIIDSMLNVYILKDSLTGDIINLQKSEITNFKKELVNNNIIISNLDSIISNGKKEIYGLNKEIIKQKSLKKISIVSNILLTIGILSFFL